MTKELQWGETPWDDMPREELIRELLRLYSAAGSMRSVLNIVRQSSPDGVFWQPGGSAGDALAKGDEVLRRIHVRHDDGSIYHAIGRYADDLLFENKALHWNWGVCSVGHLIASGSGRPSVIGDQCPVPLGEKRDGQRCSQVLRAITWDDLKPTK